MDDMKKIISSLRFVLTVGAVLSFAEAVYALPVGGTSKVFTASVSVPESIDLPVVSISGLPTETSLINDISLTVRMSDNDGLLKAIYVYKVGKSGNVEKIETLFNGAKKYSFSWNVLIPRDQVVEPGLDYYVEVTDIYGNTTHVGNSKASVESLSNITVSVSNILSMEASAKGGTLVFPDTNALDGEISMVIPFGTFSKTTSVGVKMLKFSETSAYGMNESNKANTAMVYEITPQDATLQKPVQLTLLYFDTDSNPGVVDGTQISEQQLKIFCWDGFIWRLVGGVVDAQANTVTTTVSRFGIFAVMPAAISASAYRPKERIITPNSDGYNDYAQFDGLGGSTNVEVKIFDVTGKHIRTINSQPYTWDGRDEDGRRVENGIYIYQFKVEGELISGVIAVAK